MATFDDRRAAAREGDRLFESIRAYVENAVQKGEGEVDVLEAAAQGGLELAEDDLAGLGVPSKVIAHSFLPWYVWFPWRELWSLYIQRSHPQTPGFFPGGIGLRLVERRLLTDIASAVPSLP